MGRFCPFLGDDEVAAEAWVLAFGVALVVAFAADSCEVLLLLFAADSCEASVEHSFVS